jgi:glycosyltransferase involved in cell wall biosynthesis
MQEGISFELIVVDDGSTDNVCQILDEYKRMDKRVRVITQQNQGLTKALILGCTHAQGEYITRIDAGDVALKDKLKKQLTLIKANPDAGLISCGTRFLSPGGEHLYDVIPDSEDATNRLLTLELNEIRGPSCHGSTLFAKELYHEAGGYRAAFYFAQDLDLWIRLAERGSHVIIPEILYSTSVTIHSISGQYRKEQIKLTRLILECARRRRNNEDESSLLEQASTIRPSHTRQRNNLDHARTLYFIGRCLQHNRNPEAKKYFKRALAIFPLHLKSAMRLIFGGK